MDFFSVDDLNLLATSADKAYTGSNASQKIERALSSGVWAKTKHWVKQLESSDFVAGYRASVLKQAGTTARQADGKRRMIRRFRPYTWGRLFRPGDKERKIFFTIGADGPNYALIIKLDCMRDGSKGLDGRLVARFDEYMERHAPKATWKTVQLDGKRPLDWPKLIRETQLFIEKYAEHYDAAVAYTWQESDPDLNKLARVCWNTLGWQKPSGPVGKSTSAASHESSQFAGFGAEEWLFNFSRLIDGYHYGFLQPLNSGTNGEAYAGRDFNIRLFTRNEATGLYYLVGRILNAHALTAEEREAAEAVYRREGWTADMQRELEEAGGSGTIEMGEYAQGPFNVRFKPVDVQRPDTPDGLLPIEDLDELTKSTRYKLFKDFISEPVIPPTPPDMPVRVVVKVRPPKARRVRQRQTQNAQVELAGLHDKVQDLLVAQLNRDYSGHVVSDESYIEPHGTRIDVVRQLPDKSLVFYEIKVLPTLKACIREALGQLLEYAHWPSEDLAREWVIVSYHPATPEAAEYIDKLKSVYGLPVSYLQVIIGK